MPGETDPAKQREQRARRLLRKPILTGPEARFILGFGEEKFYNLIRAGEIPVLPRRSWESRGAAYRIPTRKLKRKFGL